MPLERYAVGIDQGGLLGVLLFPDGLVVRIRDRHAAPLVQVGALEASAGLFAAADRRWAGA